MCGMDAIEAFSLNLAYQAGEIMRENFVLGMNKSWKNDNTPLTKSDTAINTLVINSVKERFPTHAVIGEEESLKNNSEYVWLCDPIDGTIPFSHGIPTSVFSLALVHNGIPIFGILYDPFMERMVTAQKGKGAFLGKTKITVSTENILKNIVINVEGATKTKPVHAIRLALAQKGVRALCLSSIAYSCMLVAAGELAAAVFMHSSPWDIAAAKVIIEEAGGVCTDLQGKDQLYDRKVNGFVASNGLIHKPLLTLINKYSIK